MDGGVTGAPQASQLGQGQGKASPTAIAAPASRTLHQGCKHPGDASLEGQLEALADELSAGLFGCLAMLIALKNL